MNSARDLRRHVEDITDDLTAQYGRNTPYCEVLHFELDLPQTQRDDAERLVAQAREKHEIEIEEGSVKLTVEHEDLHETLRRFVVDSMSQGMDSAQLAAQMLVVGRRQGLREAAAILGDH